jgi:transposase
MRFRDGLSISEIARRTSLTRNTVKKWLKEPPRSEMKYERPAGPRKLDGYIEWLRQALETDARRPRSDRRTALRLYAQLLEQGFTGSYSRVTEFMRRWKAEAGAITARSAYVPLTFDWGEAFQFDWSDEGLVIGGFWRKIQLAHMKLCASRAFWLVAYPSQGHEMLFDAHTRCLTGLGGVARRGIYDTMKTAVDRKPGALRNGAPFADLPAPLQRLSRALLRRDGGDRVMAQVLSSVPAFGLEAVLLPSIWYSKPEGPAPSMCSMSLLDYEKGRRPNRSTLR